MGAWVAFRGERDGSKRGRITTGVDTHPRRYTGGGKNYRRRCNSPRRKSRRGLGIDLLFG